MASILDQFGKPIIKKLLLVEEATPSVTGVRNILGSSQSSGLTPGKLARIIRDADEGYATPYLELAEELEEKDTHYASVLGTRKRAVAQLEISVDAASDDKTDIDNAKLIEEWLDRDQLESELIDILDAVGKGFSVHEIIWEMTAEKWFPKELKWKDPRWFEFDRDDGETLLLREGATSAPLSPYKYIVHQHKSKSGLPIRGGIFRPVVWMWMFKNFSIKDWVIFCEAYGQPVRVGKYGAGASQKDKDILMRAVANIGSDAAAIIPESMQIEFIEAASKSGSIDAFERLCNFCDMQISKAVLGQTTTTDAVSGGHAVSKEHNDVRGDIERADSKQLAATLNQQLVRMIVDLNKGPQKRYPHITIGREDDVDTDKLSTTAQRAVNMGMKVSASRLRDKLGLPAPDGDDDILVPLAKDQAAADPAKNSASSQLAIAAQGQKTDRDAIDDITDELSRDWEEIVVPVADQIEDVLKECASFEEAKQKILELSGQLRMKELAQKLERASLNLRLAAHAGATIDKD